MSEKIGNFVLDIITILKNIQLTTGDTKNGTKTC